MNPTSAVTPIQSKSNDPNFPSASATPGGEAPEVARGFTARDVREILRERGWLGTPAVDATNHGGENNNPAIDESGDKTGDETGKKTGEKADASALSEWIERATALLGAHAPDRAALAGLLALVFHYDASAALRTLDAQAVMAREGAREVIRELAIRVLDGPAIDSDRFKALIEDLKSTTRYRSRELFHPIRLALAGRVGEGELDRVILLLDSAGELPFAIQVKSTRQRMLEFCAALD